MNNNLTFFVQPGPITNPGAYAKFLGGLPGDMGELSNILQGTTVHIF